MDWILVYKDRVLTRESVRLSQLQDQDFLAFIVHDDKPIFIYLPSAGVFHIPTSEGGPVTQNVSSRKQPFFLWKNVITVSTQDKAEASRSRTLTFGLVDCVQFIQTQTGFEVIFGEESNA